MHEEPKTSVFRLMIVEDEESIRRGLKTGLPWSEAGFTVVADAAGCEEALRMLPNVAPDVLLTDIRMPGKSGLELIAAVQQINPKIQCVILTGYAEFDYAHKAMEMGVRHYLLKPTDDEQIRAVFSQLRDELLSQREDLERRDHLSEDAAFGRRQRRRRLLEKLLAGCIGIGDSRVTDAFENDRWYAVVLVRSQLVSEAAEAALEGHFQEVFADMGMEIASYPPDGYAVVLQSVGRPEDAEGRMRTVGEALCEKRWSCVASGFLPGLFGLSEAAEKAVSGWNAVGKPEGLTQSDDVIVSVKQYLQAHYGEKIALSDLSKKFHINATYLSGLFKRRTGVALMEYVTQLRILRAKELLSRSTASITDIAAEVGYPDYRRLCNIYKRSTGYTPSEYRAAMRGRYPS